ncbi:Vta1 like-domain-containing protein [Terfezia claveryi]|nr:Vta1 like-domain-containing protein [Terfezia claveryi]
MPVSKPPAKLKTLVPFITRAHQIEKTDPTIAYWCLSIPRITHLGRRLIYETTPGYYWAVQLVLSGNLHSGDAEATQYTTALLDDLEARKERLLPNDAVTDDLAAQAYIENFATRVFNNADKALQARKVSRQTADNFLAASTFLELCKIFPNIDPEILSKIKFSKYQASRIIKAFQAGEDPNLPAPEAERSLSPAFNPENKRPTPPPRPAVEDEQDEDSHLPPLPQFHPSLPTTLPITHSLTANPPPSTTSTSDRFPLHHKTHSQNNLTSDSDYFPTIPTVPTGHSHSPLSPDLTTTNTPAGPMSPFHMPARAEAPHHPPPADIIYTTETDDISHLPPPHPQYPYAPLSTQFPPQHFDQSSALHISHSYTPPPPPPSIPYGAPSTPHQYYSTSPPTSAPVHTSPPRSAPQPQLPPQPQPQYYHSPKPTPQESFVDEESVTKAQKHAKWAISALNYDDISTAVKELRAALKTLGAS